MNPFKAGIAKKIRKTITTNLTMDRKACISVNNETKNKLKAMGSKGDTYDDVISGLVGLSMILSDSRLATSLAKDCGMDEAFVKKLGKFCEGLVERGARYRNYDYAAQKMMIRLDMLS